MAIIKTRFFEKFLLLKKSLTKLKKFCETDSKVSTPVSRRDNKREKCILIRIR